jgi:uncharacterized membrane protein AbrB (regulator of aidB expression)
MQKLLFLTALLLGIFFAWIDSRPNWDDAGVLVGGILLSAAVLGALGSQRPWLWALAVGAPMPLYGFWLTHRLPASAVAVAIALVGAYVGAVIRGATSHPVPPRS